MDVIYSFIHNGGQGWLSPAEWKSIALVSSLAYTAMILDFERLPCSCSIFHAHITEAFLCFLNTWTRQDALLVEQMYGPASYIISPQCYRIFNMYHKVVRVRGGSTIVVSSQSKQCCSYRHAQMQLAGFDKYNRSRMASNDLGFPTQSVLTAVDRQVARTHTCLNRDVPHRALPPLNLSQRSVVWRDPTAPLSR